MLRVKILLFRTYTTLRPYQQKCVEAIVESFNNKLRPAVSLPTGSGKTRIFSHLLQHVKPIHQEDKERKKVLIIVNRTELINQSAEAVQRLNPGISVCKLSGKAQYDPNIDVFISTYQTVSNTKRLNAIDPSKFKLIVIDEAHHSAAESYLKILEYFNAIGKLPEEEKKKKQLFLEDSNSEEIINTLKPRKAKRVDPESRSVHVVGFSATFWRNDKEYLSDIFDEVVYHENVEDMISNGYLCPAKITDVKIPAEYSRHTFDHENGIVYRPNFFESDFGIRMVYDVWFKQSTKYKSTVIFGSCLDQIERICQYFRQNGVDARIINSTMMKKLRHETITDFNEGKFPVILNCQVLTEGTDIPRIDQIIFARGLSTTSLAMQMIGRGLRLYPNKTHCNIVVFSNFNKFMKNLDFLPQLEGFDASKTRNAKERFKIEETDIPGVNYRDIKISNSSFSLDNLTKKDYYPKSPKASPLRWISRNKQYYLFMLGEASRKTYFKISNNSAGGFEVSLIKSGYYTIKKTLFSSARLSDATKFADAYVHRTLKGKLDALAHDAPWLGVMATSKQMQLLNKIAPQINWDKPISRGAATMLLNLILINFKLSQTLADDAEREFPLHSNLSANYNSP